MDAADVLHFTPTLAGMPIDVVEAVARHLIANPLDDSYAPQANLLNLACTCKHIFKAAHVQLYDTIVIPDLQALPLLSRALSTLPQQNAAQLVRVIALAPTFLDHSQNDLHVGITNLIKYAPHGCANPDAFKLKYIGKDTGRSLLMAWFTHFAQLAPNLRGIDLSRTVHFPPQHALGFGNLAPVLRQRGAWFRGPRHGLFPLTVASCVSHPSGEVVPKDKGSPFMFRQLVYFVTFIDFGRKWLDLENPSMPPEQMASFNLHPLETFVEEPTELTLHWKVRNIKFTDPGDTDPFRSFASRLPLKSQRLAFACGDMGYCIYLNNDRRLPPPPNMPKGHRDDIPPPKYGGTIALHTPNISVACETLEKHRMHPLQCTHLNLSHTIRPDILKSSPRQYWNYIYSLADFGTSTFARASHQLWNNVTTLTLGAPLFSKAPTQDGMDSVVLLTMHSHLFPNVTSLTLEPYHVSIYDCLISLDVFVRRHPSIGKPLRELAIYRQSTEPGLCYMMGRPPLTDKATGKPLRYTRISTDKPAHGHLRKLVLVDKAQYPPQPNSEHPPLIMIHPGILHGIQHLNVRQAGAPLMISPPRLATPASPSFPSIDSLDWDNPRDRALAFGHTHLPNLRTLMVSLDHYALSPLMGGELTSIDDLFPAAPNLHSFYMDGDYCEVITIPQVVDAILRKYPKLRNAYVAYSWFSSEQVVKLRKTFFGAAIRECRPLPNLSRLVLVNDPEPPSLYVVPREEKTGAGTRKRKSAASRQPINMESEGVWTMGEVGEVFMSDVKVPGEFTLAPVEDGVIVQRLPKADLGPEPEAPQNRIPKFGQRCKCGKQRMGAVSAGAAEARKVKPMRAREAKKAAKAAAVAAVKQGAADVEAEKVLAWVDPADGAVVCEECDAERRRVNHGRFGRRVLRCEKVTDSRVVVGDGVWPLTVAGGQETVRIDSLM